MKKWILVFFIIIFLGFAGFFYFNKPAQNPQYSSNVLSESDNPLPSAWPQSTVVGIGVSIRISWAIVSPKDIKLYSNLNEQKLSEEIKADKSCSVLVSGGFYSEDNTHLGLFVSNFKTISKFSPNPTRNGFLSIDPAGSATIGVDLPNNNPRLAVQSGPLLMQRGQSLLLSINNDEPDRRIVAGTTPDDKLIFLVLYKDQSEYEGSMLENLPEMLNLFKKQTGIDIVDAINLDGGKHSIFISNYDLLRELEIAGSYFCVK